MNELLARIKFIVQETGCAADPALLCSGSEKIQKAGFAMIATPDDNDFEARMIAMARHIAEHAEETLPLDILAGRAGLSASYFQRKFKQLFGLSPKRFQEHCRMQRAKKQLRDGADILDAVFAAGYGAASRFYEKTQKDMGMTPSAYRAGGKGEEVSYCCFSSPLGHIIMAATDYGVCYLRIGDDEADLVSALKDEFPEANIQPGKETQQLKSWRAAIIAYLEQSGPCPDIPLDLRGTAFQMRVWDFLTSIPEGETRSYTEVAAGIGKPRAVRAAASACANNRVALLVPCHRVLRSDGGLGGYRWGIERKRALLKAEKKKA